MEWERSYLSCFTEIPLCGNASVPTTAEVVLRLGGTLQIRRDTKDSTFTRIKLAFDLKRVNLLYNTIIVVCMAPKHFLNFIENRNFSVNLNALLIFYIFVVEIRLFFNSINFFHSI